MSKNSIGQTVKNDGGALMVWESLGGEISGEFVQIKGIMGKEACHSLLLQHYFSFQ